MFLLVCCYELQQAAEINRQRSEAKVAAVEEHLAKFKASKELSLVSTKDTLMQSLNEKEEIARRKEALAIAAEERLQVQLEKYELQAEKVPKSIILCDISLVKSFLWLYYFCYYN